MSDFVPCACGCGKTIRRLDPKGRPRRFVNGHNAMLVVTRMIQAKGARFVPADPAPRRAE